MQFWDQGKSVSFSSARSASRVLKGTQKGTQKAEPKDDIIIIIQESESYAQSQFGCYSRVIPGGVCMHPDFSSPESASVFLPRHFSQLGYTGLCPDW